MGDERPHKRHDLLQLIDLALLAGRIAIHGASVALDAIQCVLAFVETLLRLLRTPENASGIRITRDFAGSQAAESKTDRGKQQGLGKRAFHNRNEERRSNVGLGFQCGHALGLFVDLGNLGFDAAGGGTQ